VKIATIRLLRKGINDDENYDDDDGDDDDDTQENNYVIEKLKIVNSHKLNCTFVYIKYL
jgi:hypothetical protein